LEHSSPCRHRWPCGSSPYKADPSEPAWRSL